MASPTGSRRVILRIDPRSVFRVCLLLYAAVALVGLIALTLLWWVGRLGGAIEAAEDTIGNFGLDDFRFLGPQLLLAGLLGSSVLVVAGAGATALVAAFYNVISESTGGIKVEVWEQGQRRRGVL